MVRAPRWVLAALLALGAMPAATALTFDEAASQLSSEDFAEREAGEMFLSTLGMDAEPRLEGLVKSQDPEVAFRARRALLCVRLALGATVPPEVLRKVTALREMTPREVRATVDEVLALKPGLLTLAGLHTEVLNKAAGYARLNPESFELLSNTFKTSAAAPAEAVAIAQINPDLYRNETLGILAAGFAQRHAENLTPLLAAYSSWIAKRPELPPLLPEMAIPLEIARIQADSRHAASPATAAKNQVVEMLAFANSFPNTSRQRKLVLAGMAEGLRASNQSPIDALDLEQGITLLAALQDNWTPQMDASLYERFRQRFPKAQPPKNTTLEVTYLLEKEGVNAALALALSQPNPHAALWLGSWLQAHPDKIPDPLLIPAIAKEKRGEALLRPFITGLVPQRTFAEMEANPGVMAASEALLRDEQWLAAALQANVALPFYFHWIRHGTLDAAIPKHLTGSTDRLRALGRLLASKPEAMAAINPAHQNPLDLQRILLGMLEQPLPRPIATVVFAQADDWLKLYPDMWRTNAFRFDIPRAECLAANGNEAIANLLRLAPKHAAAFAKDDPAYVTLLRSLKRFSQEAQTFPTANLTAEEGSLFFATFAATPETEKLFAERYEAFRQRQAKAKADEPRAGRAKRANP
jgi:hypothetical protein